MADVPQTLTTLASHLVTDMKPGVQQYLEQKALMFKWLQKAEEPFDKSGNIEIRAQSAANVQVGSYSDNGALGQYGSPVIKKFTVTATQISGLFKITGPALRRNTADRSDAQDLLAFTEMDLRMSLEKELNRQFWCDGTGRLGINSTSASGSSTDLVFDGPRDLARYFRENQYCWGQFAANGGANSGAYTVSSVAYSTGTVTFTGNVHTDAEDNDIFYLSNSTPAYIKDIDLKGMLYHCDDGTNYDSYQGLTRSSDGSFTKAKLMSNSGTLRSLSKTLMLQAKAARTVNSSYADSAPMKIVCDIGMKDAYVTLFEDLMRFQPGKIEGGTLTATYDGVDFETDIDCPYHSIFFLTPDTFKLYVGWPLGVYDLDGQPLKQVVGEDAYWGGMTGSYQIGCHCPPGNTHLTDISQTVIHKV